MSNTNTDFGIRINSQVDLSGLKATLAALEADTAAAERMGVAVGNAHKEIESMRSKITAYEDASRKAAHAAEELGLSHHELKIALKDVLETVGGGEFAGVLHGLFSPEALGAFALIDAVQQLTKYLAEMKQQAIDAAQAMRELRQGLLAAQVTATQEATRAQDQFKRSLDAVGQSQDRLTHESERGITILREQTKHTEDLVDAQLKLYQARINAAVIEGKMSQGDADAHSQELERRARAQKDAAEDAQATAEIEAKRRRASSAQGEINSDEGSLGGLRARSVAQATSLLDLQDRK